MPTNEQINRVIHDIEMLIGGLEVVSVSGERVIPTLLEREGDFHFWGDLTQNQRRDALNLAVDWTGFTEARKVDVIRRVLDGEEADFWMDGVKAQAEQARHDDAGELRMNEKEHAAYPRDIAASNGLTVKEMDDYDARMEKEFFLPRAPAADREAGPGVYQVWHDAGWPERAGLNARHGVETPFPQGFLHVADVEADSLGQAVALTGGAGYLAGPDGGLSWQPWETNPRVRAWALLSQTRDTERGDVIVDPRGNAHRYDGRGFRAIEAAADERTAADPAARDATIGISRATLQIAADGAFPEPSPSLTAAILDNPRSFLPDPGPGSPGGGPGHDHGPHRGR